MSMDPGSQQQVATSVACQSLTKPNPSPPIALVATDAPKRVKPSNYPPPFASQMEGR